MKFSLDFSIQSAEDRCNLVKSIDLTKLTPKELETCSNYILYGKDSDGTSPVDRKEIQIKSKFSSYKKKEPESLDALLESPTFNENIIVKGKNLFTKPKQNINEGELKEKAKQVPGMEELQAQIGKFQDFYREGVQNQKFSQRDSYLLNHWLIDLRKHQYYLLESQFPTLTPVGNKAFFYPNLVDEQVSYEIFPVGVKKSEDDYLFEFPRLGGPRPEVLDHSLPNTGYYLNFLDKGHIYHLIQFYWDLKLAVEDLPDSPIWNLLWTLDFYIKKANLSPQQLLIIEGKKLRLSNKEICKKLKEELNIYHQDNYISTIWNKICGLIADAAALHLDEWKSRDEDKKWKNCNCCGKELLRDPRNFVRKTKASDGLTNKCKECDKLLRGYRPAASKNLTKRRFN